MGQIQAQKVNSLTLNVSERNAAPSGTPVQGYRVARGVYFGPIKRQSIPCQGCLFQASLTLAGIVQYLGRYGVDLGC